MLSQCCRQSANWVPYATSACRNWYRLSRLTNYLYRTAGWTLQCPRTQRSHGSGCFCSFGYSVGPAGNSRAACSGWSRNLEKRCRAAAQEGIIPFRSFEEICSLGRYSGSDKMRSRASFALRSFWPGSSASGQCTPPASGKCSSRNPGLEARQINSELRRKNKWQETKETKEMKTNAKRYVDFGFLISVPVWREILAHARTNSAGFVGGKKNIIYCDNFQSRGAAQQQRGAKCFLCVYGGASLTLSFLEVLLAPRPQGSAGGHCALREGNWGAVGQVKNVDLEHAQLRPVLE